jgi:hypothetical protein
MARPAGMVILTYYLSRDVRGGKRRFLWSSACDMELKAGWLEAGVKKSWLTAPEQTTA